MSDERPNIVFIVFDSGRADRVGFGGVKKGTTPFLDSLAEKGAYFTHAFATGPGSSVSSTGFFTSTYPLDYGGYAYMDKPRVLLSEAMKDNGYHTVAVHSSPYHTKYFGYERGWDIFNYASHFRRAGVKKSGVDEKISAGFQKTTLKSRILRKIFATRAWLKRNAPLLAPLFIAAEKIILLPRKILKDILDFKLGFYTADELTEEVKKIVPVKPEKPLFLWMYYMDAHVPYGMFAKKHGNFWMKLKFHLSDIALFLVGEGPRFLNRLFIPLYKHLYDASLRFVDDNIKELLRHLRSLGIDETNTVFVFLSDHGEAFYEHGTFGHTQILFNVNIQVPLIVYAPQYVKSPAVVDSPVSLLDVPTTLLDIARIPRPSSYKGKNLFEADGREVVAQASESDGDLTSASFTGRTIISKGYKLIHWKNEKYLFALSDREEKHNLYHDKKDIVRDLEDRLSRYGSSL